MNIENWGLQIPDNSNCCPTFSIQDRFGLPHDLVNCVSPAEKAKT